MELVATLSPMENPARLDARSCSQRRQPHPSEACSHRGAAWLLRIRSGPAIAGQPQRIGSWMRVLKTG